MDRGVGKHELCAWKEVTSSVQHVTATGLAATGSVSSLSEKSVGRIRYYSCKTITNKQASKTKQKQKTAGMKGGEGGEGTVVVTWLESRSSRLSKMSP